MKTLLVMMMLTLHAAAQRELWKWEPTASVPEDFHATAIHAAAAEPKGSAAVVIGEVFRETGGVNQQRFRLLWISSKGGVVHEAVVPQPDEEIEVILAGTPTAWRILALSATGWAITDGKVVWTAALKGKAKTSAQGPLAAGTDAFEAGSLPVFEGWFQRKTTQVGAYIAEGIGERPMLALDSLSLRTLK